MVSLRRTLAVRHGLTMAVALLGIAGWAYLGVRDTLAAQLDQSLRTTFELQRLSFAATGRINTTPASLSSEQFVRRINRLVIVRDSAGRVLQANHPLAGGLPLDTVAFRRARSGAEVARSTEWAGGAARSLAGPLTGTGPAAVLEVAASEGSLDAAGRTVLSRMLLTVALGSLATLVGAYWLASSALAPVEQIAAQAAAIHGTRGGQRITTHAGVAELAGLVQVLNGMLARLERASEWHRRIIRDLGHDLRTPVATMRAAIEVTLRGRREPEEYRRALAGTLEEVDRLALIGEALSLLGALESGTLRPALASADLWPLAEAAAARARGRASGHAVDVTGAPAPLEAAVDPRLLGMALDQLLDNALRHTPPGTRVEVALGAAGDRLRVTVEDEGPGVAPEMLPHLFDRFYRADAARGRNGGPGLGLSTVAIIADLHRGQVAAAAGRRGGLRVTLELPRA